MGEEGREGREGRDRVRRGMKRKARGRERKGMVMREKRVAEWLSSMIKSTLSHSRYTQSISPYNTSVCKSTDRTSWCSSCRIFSSSTSCFSPRPGSAST